MGARLRHARVVRGITLRSMARRVGVSPSLISQVETGRANPSVSTLYALVNELGVSLDELLFTDARLPDPGADDDGPAPENGVELLADTLPRWPVQGSQGRPSIRLASGVQWERLTTESLQHVDFLFVTYEVGGASSPSDAFQRHAGFEFGYILSGELRLNIGFEEYLLKAGDAITFDASTPHRLSNAGETSVTAVWFVVGRRGASAGQESRSPG
jgi:transcriptional regulator with XRE-family HTH domain/quercetin dioxygenase-like cupin family protein